MTMAKMAFRNVWRYRRRSLITAIAIALGVLFSIMVDAMLYGAERESARNIREYETGDVKAFAPGYFEERQFLPFEFFIESGDRQRIEAIFAAERQANGSADDGSAGLSTARPVSRWAPRVVGGAELYFTEEFFPVAGSAEVKFHAVDPEREETVFRTPRMIEKGRWLKKGDEGIVIGGWLAEDIGADVGYMVSVELKGRGGFYQTFDAEIVGIALTDNPYVNRSAIYMDLSRADELLALEGAVTEYAIAFPPEGKKENHRKALSSAVARSMNGGSQAPEIYGWDEIESDAVLLTKTKSGGSKAYLFFMFVIAAVGISNTMLMAVMERKNEIGMLRSLGYGNSSIRWLFLVEGFAIGLIGTAAGTLFGSVIVALMVEYGIDFSFMMREMDAGYRLTGVMRSAWHPQGMLSAIVGALVISSAVAWFPSGRILKAEVAEILRS